MLALIPLRAVWLLPPLVAGCLALASAAAATAPSKRDQRYSACEVRATDGKQPCTRSGKKGPRTTKGLVKGLQRQLDRLAGRVEQLEQEAALRQTTIDELSELLRGVTRTEVDGGDLLRFSAMNVQIVNGEGDTAAANGLGNLIVGYNADVSEVDGPDDRLGSHNLVVGDEHTYAGFGGAVFGFNNAVSNGWSVVSGGAGSIAAGLSSSVSGGQSNVAAGDYSSVSGGSTNTAAEALASVSGGANNIAAGELSSVSGGTTNIAAGALSAVAGGETNTAEGPRSAVGGGRSNVAEAEGSTVSGGSFLSALVAWQWMAGELCSPGCP